MKPKVKKLLWIAPLAIIGLAVFVALGGQIVMHLWNWLLPPLFGWHTVDFWQALGLLVLCRILFGGPGLHGGRHGRWHRRGSRDCEPMSAEERGHWRERLHQRWHARHDGEGGEAH